MYEKLTSGLLQFESHTNGSSSDNNTHSHFYAGIISLIPTICGKKRLFLTS
jgi:hypothetical protein